MPQIKAAIESNFYDWIVLCGQNMYVAYKTAPDGTLLSMKSEGGDPALSGRCWRQPDRKFLNRLAGSL
jgi:membrane protein involved in colicin uptake